MFDCIDLFYENLLAKEKIIVNQGGTDSGKTHAILQCLLYIVYNEKPPAEDPIMTVVGESVPNLTRGSYRKMLEIISNSPFLSSQKITINQTTRTLTFGNGWKIEFNSYLTNQSAKQGKRQYLFINECNGVNYQKFWELAKRTRVKVFLDYNPTARFWVHEKLIGTTKNSNDLSCDVKLIISDHRGNTFLSENEHARTEGILDKELWRVYARGLTGNVEGLVFTNWEVITEDNFPKVDCIYGIDFGYTNDPTTLIKTCKIGNNIYAHEMIYKTGISMHEVSEVLKADGYKGEVVFTDHDEQLKNELRHLDVNAYFGKKGQGSVMFGINYLKQRKVYYTESSKNIHIEKNRYMFQKDQSTGKFINKPIDKFNHTIDAIRYAQVEGRDYN